ncbi:MAG: hypothetical protein QOE64_1440 [Frankiales bacterium]|nr:hypothetical protein [Frankiales bacterium]
MQSLDNSPHIRPQWLVDVALHLSSIGLLDRDNAAICGVAIKTIRRWRRLYERRGLPRGGGSHSPPCPTCEGRELDERAYSALLGFYLGDGHIVRVSTRRSTSLRLSVVQDAKYPDSVEEIAGLMEVVKKGGTWRKQVPGAVCVESIWRHWPCLFPQHGPGRKHHRPIVLADWQREIVQRHPEQFLRGLFHSDGCRVANWATRTNTVGVVVRHDYTRYFFSNMSDDIRGLCTWALELLSIPYKHDGRKIISVARKEAVAVLDTFIGPKH